MISKKNCFSNNDLSLLNDYNALKEKLENLSNKKWKVRFWAIRIDSTRTEKRTLSTFWPRKEKFLKAEGDKVKKLITLSEYLWHRENLWKHSWPSYTRQSLEKKTRPERDSSPWPLWYWWSTLATELLSQLRPGHIVSSQYTRRWWRMQMNIWDIIYLNCERFLNLKRLIVVVI